MELKNLDFQNVVNEEQVRNIILNNFTNLGKEWVAHQWIWLNGIYKSFNDHIKFFIIISLVEKTLDFYHQVNITKSYDEYYSSTNLQIDKFTIVELCEKLKMPKETIRRKVDELEKTGVIIRKKKIIKIDRSAFTFVQPKEQIPITSKYLAKISDLLFKEKIFFKKIDAKAFEKIIKKNFSLCWRWYYKMQIPTFIKYQEIFKDLTTFHIWGTITMNQAFNLKTFGKKIDYENWIDDLLIKTDKSSQIGVSAMSISDMTTIPRATVTRKCKFLIDKKFVEINEKKQYLLTSSNKYTISPFQQTVFNEKAKFLTRILNLISAS